MQILIQLAQVEPWFGISSKLLGGADTAGV